MDLFVLLQQHEGKTLEFKRDLSSPEGLLRTIAAFANTAGGVLLIGVEDRTRNVRGLSRPLDEEERLASLIHDSIAPRLVPEIEVLPWRKAHVLCVQVHPSGSRPHHVQSEGPRKGTYVRVGSTNRVADLPLIEERKRYARAEAYDEQALPEATMEDLDVTAATDAFSARRKLSRRDLESLRLVTRYQGRTVPTVGGLLLFGIERERWFSDAWIQIGRFGGRDRTRLLDHLELRELPIPAIERCVAYVQQHLRRGVEIGAVRRSERWEVPAAAMREAIVNAVAHADDSQRGGPHRVAIYQDRLEIESPGLLLLGLTVEDLRSGLSRLRNRGIGRTFHELGLIESWGSGVPRMISTCRDAGLAEPVFEEVGLRFRVTFYFAATQEATLDELDRTILSNLQEPSGRSTAELAAAIGRSARATRTRLKMLVDRGLVREIGSGPNDPRRRYHAAREDRAR
jgi:ATP-dependent DNA helicase RecG